MSHDIESRPAPIPITLWKRALLAVVVALFGGSLFEYFSGHIDETAGWLWPMLFVPLLLYLLGIIYGDVPARYYNLDTLKPFPVPFARQFDRCVLALIVLFTGLMLNMLLLAASIALGAQLMIVLFYSLYTLLMLSELPNSLRIFRFIQHVNTMQYVNTLRPNMFKPALAYYAPEQDSVRGESRQKLLEEVYKNLLEEAKALSVEASPLKEQQQIALNLAVRSGEAIQRCRFAAAEGDSERVKANLMLLEALQENAQLELPKDIRLLYKKEGEVGEPVAEKSSQKAHKAS